MDAEGESRLDFCGYFSGVNREDGSLWRDSAGSFLKARPHPSLAIRSRDIILGYAGAADRNQPVTAFGMGGRSKLKNVLMLPRRRKTTRQHQGFLPPGREQETIKSGRKRVDLFPLHPFRVA
ncbi:hypothetical protein [Beijerinckia mobilis]|uniref:hypothetical protein n=1 Tax=Beijerinckia mobilis TaxID=231434 RepID=UPI000559453D|nr:hypothetical protein [Beijerinckia mobilis]